MLIGANVGRKKPWELKQVMLREGLGWRSFCGSEAISNAWNSPGTPRFYLVDHAGVIRRSWAGHPGEKTLDRAIGELVGTISGAETKR